MAALAAALFIVLACLGALIVALPIAFRGIVLLAKAAFWIALLAVACAVLR
jgi:hypothetical protein